MITTPTVFILGAGGSQPYGYPTGSTLRTQLLYDSPSMISDALKHLDIQDADRQRFQEAFRRSEQSSIDAFLEKRPSLRRVGVAMVAAHIMCMQADGKYWDRQEG